MIATVVIDLTVALPVLATDPASMRLTLVALSTRREDVIELRCPRGLRAGCRRTAKTAEYGTDRMDRKMSLRGAETHDALMSFALVGLAK